MELEATVGEEFVRKYHGFRRLTDSFLEFFAETLSSQAAFNGKFGWPKEQPYYVTCLVSVW